MKKIKVLFGVLLLAIVLLIAGSAVSDIMKARKIETAVSGGYESLLAYENRENSDTFVSPDAYVQEKSLHYQREADALYRRAGIELLACSGIFVLEIGMYFVFRKENKRNRT